MTVAILAQVQGNIDYGELQVPESEAGALGAVLLDASSSSKLLSQLDLETLEQIQNLELKYYP